MGNCIGRKTHLRYKQQQQQQQQQCVLPFYEQGFIIVQSLSSKQNQCLQSQLSNEYEYKQINQKAIDFNRKTKSKRRRTSESFDTSSLYSSLSSHPSSFTSDDQLILSTSSSSSSSSSSLFFSDQIYFSPKCDYIFTTFSTLLPHCIHSYLHTNIISHHCSILSSVIDDVIQQQSIRIHRQTSKLLLEYQPFYCIQFNELNQFDRPSFIFHDEEKHVYITKYAHCPVLSSLTDHSENGFRQLSPCDNCSSLLSSIKFTEYFHSFLIANITYNFMKIYLEKNVNQRNLFGYISSIDFNRIRQIFINNSKYSHSSNLDIHSMDISLVIRVQSWPKEIRSIYEQRHRSWPIDITSLFQSTCFIQSNGNQYQTTITTNSCSNCEQIQTNFSSLSSWSYNYAAIEHELIRLMSNEQKRFASINWNYLNKKSDGNFPFQLFKHTLFYFFEKYSSNVFNTNDFTDQISNFFEYLLQCFQNKYLPHYFNSNLNLYNEKISIDWIIIPITFRHSLIYTLPDSSMYLTHLKYLIEFQSKFLDDFPSVKNNITQAIIETDQYVREKLLTNHSIFKHSLTLDCLYRYQQSNVQIIIDYLPLLRLHESSLLLHACWSIFIQYFHGLFNELFSCSNDQVQSSSSISE